MSHEQLATFLSVTHSRASKRDSAFFLTLADTGLRPGEALALQWEDVDITARSLNVERAVSTGRIKATKTEESRRVDLTARAAEALSALQAMSEAEALVNGDTPSPWIFPSRTGTPLDAQRVGRRFRSLVLAAGLPRFRLYDLRHSYATHLLALGAPLTYVSAQLGHRKPTTTLAFYAHWIPRGDKEWIDRLSSERLAAPLLRVPGGAVPTTLWHHVGTADAKTLGDAMQVREVDGSPGWARTSDFLINSQALYQLSYRGTR